MSDQPLASFSLTHVHYDPSDPLSHLSAWLALFPQGLCIVYSTLLLSTREFEIGLAFAGQLACEAFNWILKRLIKEQRPQKIRHLGKGYGMPSSHAQFVGFWAVYIGLWLWLRFNPRRKVERAYSPTSEAVEEEVFRSSALQKENDSPIGSKEPKVKHGRRKSDGNGSPNAHEDASEPNGELFPLILPDSILSGSAVSPIYALQLHHPHLTKFFLTGILLSISIPVCISRIYLGYHTARQVYVGATVGALCAVAWFVATEYARRYGFVDLLLDIPLLRSMRIRDLCCEDDLVELGWSVWEQKRRRRRSKRRKSVRFAGLPPEDQDDKHNGTRKNGEDGKKRRKKV